VLRQRFTLSPSAATSRRAFDDRMAALGLDVQYASTSDDTPAALTLNQSLVIRGRPDPGRPRFVVQPAAPQAARHHSWNLRPPRPGMAAFSLALLA
jgi:hypothetical protein